jgi:hypothetical protein
MDEKEELELEQAEEVEDEQRHYVSHGRTLTIGSDGANKVLDIRAASGELELRVKLTENGPVLHLEGVRLEMTAAEDIDLNCRTFSVTTTDSLEINSEKDLKIGSKDEMTIESREGDLRVRGKIIWLN